MAIIPAEEKVFMVSKGTNTTYSGSASLKAMQQWYTMQDISDSIDIPVAPYKVFTALLSQSGGNNPLSLSSGAVQEGVSYRVRDANETADFSNVGGPGVGQAFDFTWFIATASATPNSYGNGQLEYDTGAPIATVLENTIGDVWFTYSGTGNYFLNSDSLFTNGTWTNISLNIQGFGDNINFSMYQYNADNIVIVSGTPGDSQYDNYLNQTCIEVRIYN